MKQVSEKYISLNNTFFRSVKEDPQDTIDIEIGDSKQPDFKPQFKVMRWKNEINFSIRAEEHPEASIQTNGEVIKYITPEYEVHQYDKPEAGEDGGFEFEWVLPAKPLSNVLTATIQTKGLDFFYQPELTPEEITRGCQRPNNVVGSYAVYHSTFRGMNDVDGMKYKTGKAFHIYRPKCVDSNGIEIFADLNIDKTEGILTVTIPQKFLDKATYPVVVDPTFGYTSAGASDYDLGGATTADGNYGQHTISESGNVTQISAFVKVTVSRTHTIEMTVYDNDGVSAKPSTRLTPSVTFTGFSNTTYQQKDKAITVNGLSTGDYYLCIFGDSLGPGDGVRVAYDSTTGAYYAAVPDSFCPNPALPNGSALTGKISTFATYTTSVARTSVSGRLATPTRIATTGRLATTSRTSI